MIKFVLPFPPSVNKLFPTVGKKRTKSKAYEDWLVFAGNVLNQQNVSPITERVFLIYELSTPDNYIRDAGNYEKAITDLLVLKNILQDDCRKYIKGVSIIWSDIIGNHVNVTILKGDVIETFPLWAT